MKIFIQYESSWRNSFLNGSNNEKLPVKGRKYIGSMTSLKSKSNFIERKITRDTVMGVLNRLIGDQRKLYQSRLADDYFFKELEPQISFKDNSILTNDMTYIRNITGSTDQNSFTGAIKVNDPIFNSDYSLEFWGVLALNFEDLCEFITDKNYIIKSNIELNPLGIINRLEFLNKVKPIENGKLLQTYIDDLHKSFEGINYLNKEKVMPISMYCSALYLQLQRLENAGINVTTAKTKDGIGGIAGISKRGFTKKDFMNKYTTGEKKRIWGNPYIHVEFIKKEGKTKHLMTKARGKLEIFLDINRSKAKDIKCLIENAGVSSFYLGKKGLAYVTKISTREE